MAQYKVPQDVEADDKLLGPFTFRQFIYLMVMGGCIALAVAFFQVFPLLAIIPALPAVFFAVLALPLKKDQPMETYLLAILSFHLKPKKRLWTPGQRESTILITAPRIVEKPRTRDITGEEANTRLSFLANVIDTEGYAIRDNTITPMRDDFLADSANATDVLDSSSSPIINNMINREQDARRANLVNQMRVAINNAEQLTSTHSVTATNIATNNTSGVMAGNAAVGSPVGTHIPSAPAEESAAAGLAMNTTAPEPVAEFYNPLNSSVVIRPSQTDRSHNAQPQTPRKSAENEAKLVALANNKDFSVETIAKEANRIEKNNKEVYVSLH